MPVNKRPAWLEALYAVTPLCFSYIPVGLACGMLLQKVGFNIFTTGLLSILVFSGGAQFLVVSMLAVHASLYSTILMVFFLELRYALLGSSLSQFFKKEKKSAIALFAQSMNDENYAVNYLKFSTDSNWNRQKALFVNWFSLLSWMLSTVVGTIFGGIIHIDTEMVHFALTSMFIFMFMMQLNNRLLLFSGLLSGGLAIVFMLLFQNTFGLIVATLLASFTGYRIERHLKNKQPPEPEENYFNLRSGESKHE